MKYAKKPPLLLTLFLCLITSFMVIPIAYIIQYGFLADKSFFEVLFKQETFLLLKNTLVFTLLVTFISLTIGLICAFLTECCNLPFRRLLATLISLPLCIPALVSSFTWFSINPKIINNFTCNYLSLCELKVSRVSGFYGITFVMVLVSIPLAFIPISAAIKKLDPAWIEISQSLSQGKMRTFFNAVLPQLKPAIGNAILLIALHMIIEFGAVSIMGYNTLSVAIFDEIDMYYNTQGAALYSLILLLVCLAIVGLEMRFRGQERIIRAGKGVVNPLKTIALSKIQKVIGVTFMLIIFCLGIVVPFIVLITWLLEGSAIHSPYFSGVEFVQVIFNTMWMAMGAALVTVMVSIPIVWIAVYYRSKLATFADRLPFILHAIPALLLALALVKYTIEYARPLYQTYWVLIPAYLMLYLPLAQTSVRTSIEQVPEGMINISNSLGRNKFDLIRRIIFPCIKPGVIAGLALCFLQMMKELTATLILAPGGMTTISIELWNATNSYSFSISAAYGMALIIFSGIPVFLLKHYFK